MKFFKIIIIIFTTLFFGCEQYSKETESFRKALQNYDIDIPHDKYCFIVIPVFSCHGCIQKTWLWLEENVSIKNNYNITILDGDKDDVFVKDINCELYFDTLQVLNNVCFDLANPTIIKTYNKKIISIISIDSRYIYETLDCELKYLI
ncbi:MAG: hypothetical protein II817_00305 [Bacteroidales bacterium]|nr:hypothetical protein [Bacteroidales bacterium]